MKRRYTKKMYVSGEKHEHAQIAVSARSRVRGLTPGGIVAKTHSKPPIGDILRIEEDEIWPLFFGFAYHFYLRQEPHLVAEAFYG